MTRRARATTRRETTRRLGTTTIGTRPLAGRWRVDARAARQSAAGIHCRGEHRLHALESSLSGDGRRLRGALSGLRRYDEDVYGASTTERVSDAARDMGRQARDKASALGDQAREKASALGEQAREHGQRLSEAGAGEGQCHRRAGDRHRPSGAPARRAGVSRRRRRSSTTGCRRIRSPSASRRWRLVRWSALTMPAYARRESGDGRARVTR